MKKLLSILIMFLFTSVKADNYKLALYNVETTEEFHNGLAKIYDNSTNKYGYINTSGKIVIKPIFDKAEDFNDGLAVVTTSTGKGLINTNGVFVLQPICKNVDKNEKVLNLYMTDKGCFFNNRIIMPSYEIKGTNNFPFIEYKIEDGTKYLNIITGDVFGSVRKHGNDFFQVRQYKKGGNVGEYNDMYYDLEGVMMDSSLFKSSKRVEVFKGENGKYGFKKGGQMVVEPKYTATAYNIWIKDHIIVIDDNGWLLLNSEAQPTHKAEALIVNDNDYVISINSSFKYGLFDLNGEELIPYIYTTLYSLTSNWYYCKNDKETVVINVKNGNKFSGKYFNYSNGMILVTMENNEGYYYINTETSKKLPEVYKKAYDFNEDLAIVERKDEKYRVVINKRGEILLRENESLKFQGDKFSEDVLSVEIDNTKSYIYSPLVNDFSYNQETSNTKTIDYWFDKGYELMSKKRYAEAKEYFYRIMMNDPNHSNAINNYGVCLDNMGYKQEALEAFKMAYDINPQNIIAKDNIKLIEDSFKNQQEIEEEENKSGTFWDALASFGRLIEEFAGSNSGYNNTSYSYVNNKSYEETYDNSSSTVNEVSYREMYARWEKRAESIYTSLTNTGVRYKNKDGNKSGSTLQSWSGGKYVQMKKTLRDAQREMRNIRQKAAKNGIMITQSSWETADVKSM